LSPVVFAVTAELMAATRVEALLAAVGCPVTVLEPQDAAAAIAAAGPAVVVLDLGVSPEVRAAVFRAAADISSVIAFGPHLDVAGLDGARRAGAAEVLTRGALATGLAPLVAKHLARLPSACREGR